MLSYSVQAYFDLCKLLLILIALTYYVYTVCLKKRPHFIL